MSKILPESSFVYEEEISASQNGVEKNRHTERSESLSALRSDLTKFYQLDRKLRSLNYGNVSGNSEALAHRLNTLLAKNGIGGKNGLEDDRAYFMLRWKDVVLVANTIVDGKPVSSRDKIVEAFARIDAMLSDPFSRALSEFESHIAEINGDYQKNTNDLFRLADAAINAFWGNGTDKIYESSIHSVRMLAAPMAGKFESLYFERMSLLRPKIESKTLSPAEISELRVLESQKRRFDAIMGARIQPPEWVTKDIAEFLWDTKGNMMNYALEGVKWEVTGVIKGFFAIPVFAYEYSTNSEIRKAVGEAVDSFPAQMKELAKHPEKLTNALIKEWNRILMLEPSEQSYEIGKIVGNIVGDVAFGAALAKVFSLVVKSATLRLALKDKTLTKIENVRNWEDFSKFAEGIDHIRFRRSWDAERIISVADKIRTGEMKLSEMPNIAGLRSKVEELMKHRGMIPEKTSRLQTAGKELFHSGVETIWKRLDFVARLLSPQRTAKLSQMLKEVQETTLRQYGALDIRVADLRAIIEDSPKWIKSGSLEFAETTLRRAIETTDTIIDTLKLRGITTATIESVASVRNTLLEAYRAIGGEKVAERLSTQATKVVRATRESTETILETLTKPRGNIDRLSRMQLRETIFSNGIGSFKFQLPDGKIVYRLTDSQWKFLRSPKNAKDFLEFDHPVLFTKDGTAVASKGGKFGIIDRSWSETVPHEFDFLQDFAENRKIAQKNGNYFLLERDKTTGIWRENRTNTFDFMTEPQEGVAVGIRLSSEGKQIRSFVRQDGKIIELKGKFDFVDDFTEDGLAAVRYKNKKWQPVWAVIDEKGRYATIPSAKNEGVKQFKNVEASNAAEVLERFRHEKTVAGRNIELFSESAIFRDARKLALRHGTQADNVTPTNVRGLFSVMEHGKKGFINVETGAVVKAEFDQILFHDAKNGFLRVKQNGKWGIFDSQTGKPHFDLEHRGYSSIQIQNLREGLFEVETSSWKGLITKTGEVKIEPKYQYIENPSSWVYQWVNYERLPNGKAHKIAVSKSVHINTEGFQAASAKFDPVSAVVKTYEAWQGSRRSAKAVTELDLRNMSEPIAELLDAGLPSILRGLHGIRKLKFPDFETYASLKFPVASGEQLIAKMSFQSYIRELFSAYRKAYTAEGRTISKSESIHIETVLIPHYVQKFDQYLAFQRASSIGFSLPKASVDIGMEAANDAFFSKIPQRAQAFP